MELFVVLIVRLTKTVSRISLKRYSQCLRFISSCISWKSNPRQVLLFDLHEQNFLYFYCLHHFKKLWSVSIPGLSTWFNTGQELEQTEEEELLSWEAYMKDNYLASTRQDESQSVEHRIQDTAEK